MNNDTFAYVVKQGDYLAKIAFEQGVELRDIWNHTKNAALRASRGSPNLLHPGDVLFIPHAPDGLFDLRKGEVNRFVTMIPDVDLNVRFVHLDEVLANTPCEVHGLPGHADLPLEATTDAEGGLQLKVSPLLDSLTVRFPSRELDFPLRIGHLDPTEEISGINGRLANLGFVSWTYAHSRAGAEEVVPDAIRAFQRAHGIPPTGELDDQTREAIIRAHGV